MATGIFTCKLCPNAWDMYPPLVFHYMQKHSGQAWPKRDEAMVAELPDGYLLHAKAKQEKPKVIPPVPAAAHQEEAKASGNGKKGPPNIYKEAQDPTLILKEILDIYPGMDAAVTAEIMDWANRSGSLHPMEVQNLLNTMAGVPKGAANIIPQKYALALQKAAQEGNPQVRMTMMGWGQFGARRDISEGWPGAGVMAAGAGYPGMGGAFGGFGNPGFGGFGWPGNPTFNPNWPYPPQNPNPPLGQPGLDKETEGRISQLEATVTSALDKMTALFAAQEEKKKEDELNAKFEKLHEELLAVAAARGKGDETDPKYDALLKEFSTLKDQLTANQTTRMEEQIAALKSQIGDEKDKRIAQISEELQTIRQNLKPSVVGRTSMDVIDNAVNRLTDSAKDLGKDIKSVLTAGQTREQFNPARVTASARKEAGEKLAEAAEKAADLEAKEAAFLEIK